MIGQNIYKKLLHYIIIYLMSIQEIILNKNYKMIQYYKNKYL
jgi:hypothetical protein